MKIIIVRHAEPDYSVDSLTEKGFREAKILASRLAELKIDHFFCSPLGRAKDTAAPTLSHFKKEAEILDWLQEYRGWIISPRTNEPTFTWQLPPSRWCDDEKSFSYKDWHLNELIASGNSKEIFDETATCVDQLLARYGITKKNNTYYNDCDKTIVLFCHCAIGLTVLAYLLGINPIVAQNSFFIAPASVTTIVTESEKNGALHFRAVAVGDTSHLYKANEPASEMGLYPDFLF